MIVVCEVGAMTIGVTSFERVAIWGDAALRLFLSKAKFLVQALDNARWLHEGNFDVDEVFWREEWCNIIEEVVVCNECGRSGWQVFAEAQ